MNKFECFYKIFKIKFKVYGSEHKWEDPKAWILESSPWKLTDNEKNSLRSVKAIDVGCETETEKSNVNNNIRILQVHHAPPPNDASEIRNSFQNSYKERNEGEVVMDKVLSTFTSPSKSNNAAKLNDGDNLINMLMRLQEVTMGNQKRAVSTRLINDKNLTLNNMILTIPKSVESAL